MALMCTLFGHKPDKYMRPAIGGRNVRRCLRCADILEEQMLEKRDVEHHARAHRPSGRTSDTWPK